MTKPNNNKEELELGSGPGVSAERIPELDEAAQNYATIRDSRQEMTKREVDAKKKVVDLMHANEKRLGRDPKGAIHYKIDKVTIDLVPSEEKLKVRIKGEGDEEEGGDSEAEE